MLAALEQSVNKPITVTNILKYSKKIFNQKWFALKASFKLNEKTTTIKSTQSFKSHFPFQAHFKQFLKKNKKIKNFRSNFWHLLFLFQDPIFFPFSLLYN